MGLDENVGEFYRTWELIREHIPEGIRDSVCESFLRKHACEWGGGTYPECFWPGMPEIERAWNRIPEDEKRSWEEG